MIYLPRSCVAVASLAAGGQSRYALRCVRVRELAGANFRVEATDGKLLGIVRGPSSPDPKDMEFAQTLPEPESIALEALVPAAEFERAFRSLPRGNDGRGRAVGVLLGDPVLLTAGSTVSSCPPDDGRFPDVDAVLPTKPALVSVRVSPALLIDLLRAAGAVAEEGDSPGVELLFWGRDRPLGVVAQGKDGVFFDGILMPMT